MTTWDPAAKSARVTLSGANLIATSDGVATGEVVNSTTYKSTGKWYVEFTPTWGGGSTNIWLGLTTSSQGYTDTSSLTHTTAAGDYGWGYGENNGGAGTIRNDGANAQSGLATFASGDVISAAFDADAETVQWRKNNVAVGTPQTIAAGSWAFAACVNNGTAAVSLTVNFGATAFVYSPPTGYLGIDEPIVVTVTVPAPALVTGFDGINKSLPVATLITGFNGLVKTLPVPVFSSALSIQGVSRALPAPTLSAIALPGTISTVAVVIPASVLSSVLSPASLLTVSRTVPAPILDATLVPSEIITFLHNVSLPVLSSVLLSGKIGTLAHNIPVPLLSTTLLSGKIITLSRNAPVPTISATLVPASVIIATLTAPIAQLVADALNGSIITVNLQIVAPTFSATGYPAYTITVEITAPVLQLDAALLATIVASFKTWVLNTRKNALTEYDTFAFDSYAVFNGLLLAVGSTGIVSLGAQDQDGSTAITARVRTGKETFGSAFLKRVPRAYISLTTDGDMTFRTITSEGGTRSYLLGWDNTTGLRQRRIPIGKGPKSRYWQFEAENISGADFTVDDILTYPVVIPRRVQ